MALPLIIPLPSPFGVGFGFASKSTAEPHEFTLCPEEEALLPPYTVACRRESFYLGRWAAHTALAQIGRDGRPVLQDASRAPVWPENITGSISHTDDIAIAAVADSSLAVAMGLDIESTDRRVEWDVVRRICDTQELAWVEQDATAKWVRFIRIFSAKETVFKAFFPLNKVFLDFHDAHLCWDERHSQFAGCLRKRVSPHYQAGYTFTIGCHDYGGYVMTYLAIPASPHKE